MTSTAELFAEKNCLLQVQGKEAECSDGNSPAVLGTGNLIAVQQNLKDKQLQTALQVKPISVQLLLLCGTC